MYICTCKKEHRVGSPPEGSGKFPELVNPADAEKRNQWPEKTPLQEARGWLLSLSLLSRSLGKAAYSGTGLTDRMPANFWFQEAEAACSQLHGGACPTCIPTWAPRKAPVSKGSGRTRSAGA